MSVVLRDPNPKRLARSCALGVYVAFSPFPGAHTLMMVCMNYIFDLHFPTLFVVASINNPWTAIPFFSGDYFFGYWLVHYVFGYSPSWAFSLEKFFGSGSICVWSFLIGGNLLGALAGLLCYPFALSIFKRIIVPQQVCE